MPRSLGVLHPYLSYTLSTFSSTEFPEPRGEGFGDIPFRNECSRVSLHIVELWVPLFVAHRLQEEASMVVAEQDIDL